MESGGACQWIIVCALYADSFCLMIRRAKLLALRGNRRATLLIFRLGMLERPDEGQNNDKVTNRNTHARTSWQSKEMRP